ncbi:MAG TPA: hypothetical protein VF610_12880 [Segetibacter sp.]
MKKIFTSIAFVSLLAFTSCRAGKGCPSNGRNIGAERLLSSDKQTMKDLKKAGKFRH